MAPVVTSLISLLAIAGAVEASPTLAPGRHAPHSIANILSTSRRSLHGFLARYYGTTAGFEKPLPLPEKRSSTLPTGWTYAGCVAESDDERLLGSFSFSSSSNTPLFCLTECAKRGYAIAGTEYSDECYCSNQLTGDGGETVSDSYCDMACAGDDSEDCGAAWYLSLYTYNTSVSALYCESTDAATYSSSVSAASSATIASSATSTFTDSASVTTTDSASTETASYTDTTSTDSASATESTSSTDAASVTSLGSGELVATGTGSTTETATATETDSTTESISATFTSSTSSSSSTAAIYEDSDDSEWYSLGCAIDSDDRILTGYSLLDITDLTIDDCLTLCEDQGFAYAGVEYGNQCYCGSSIPSAISYSSSVCSFACSGDASETCGGEWGLELYEIISSNSSCSSTATSTSNSASLTSTSSATSSTSTESAESTASSSVIGVENVASPSATTSTASSTASSTAADVATSTVAATTATAATSTVPASTSSHAVWVHHMVGNTYDYTESDWASDVALASAQEIDGFALNMGSDSWQPDRIADAYTAAEAAGDFKLFISFDMTSMSCSSSSDATTLVDLVKTYASSSAQATYDGKVLVSTFSGSDCTFGTGSVGGWQSLFVDVLTADGVDIFFVPSVFSDISTFSSYDWMDGELNWNSGWPMGDYDIGTDSTDSEYVSALGSKLYMPAISPFFFTHFGPDTYDKNWIYRSDDWLYCERWEEVIAMRETVFMTEILTWNDYGESSYIGPIEGDLPETSSTWVDGFDHSALSTLTAYYATAFKTGSYPAISTDSITMWSRPHPADAVASADSVGEPTNYQWTDDYLYAVVLATEAAEVTLTAGSNSETFSVSAGLTKLKLASSVGTISGTLTRDSATVVSYSAGTAFEYTDSPTTYNFNYFVGSSS